MTAGIPAGAPRLIKAALVDSLFKNKPLLGQSFFSIRTTLAFSSDC